jgi:hypothetical protein
VGGASTTHERPKRDAPLDRALRIREALGNAPMRTERLVDGLIAMGFAWGVSDGNCQGVAQV